MKFADTRERELDVLFRLHAPIEHLEHVSHARLDVVARERGLVGDGRVVEWMNGNAARHGILVVYEAVRLGELFRYGEDGPLYEHELVVADVHLLLHEAKRAKARQANALGLRHELFDVGGHLVPYLNDIYTS